MILGHNFPEVKESVLKACEKGLSFGCATAIEVEMAEFICDHIPHVDMVRMVNSGTEAVMSAVRVARGFTGKNKIIKFAGCYHGHSDAMLVSAGSLKEDFNLFKKRFRCFNMWKMFCFFENRNFNSRVGGTIIISDSLSVWLCFTFNNINTVIQCLKCMTDIYIYILSCKTGVQKSGIISTFMSCFIISICHLIIHMEWIIIHLLDPSRI